MIDTHIHLDEEAYDADREAMIARQAEHGVEAMFVPGVNAKSIEGILDVCRKHKGLCYAALGFHPQEITPSWESEWEIIEEAIRKHSDELIAIGEIGLDYHYDPTYKEEQHEAFQRQLSLANELELPVMIHSRDATEETVGMLRAFQNGECKMENGNSLRGVVHCFNGSKETATEYLKMGLYLGIGGVITFKNCKLADTLRELKTTGIDILSRIVLETDGPYLAPTPHRGERNESWLMRYVVDKLAEVFDCTPEHIIEVTSDNARTLFSKYRKI